MPMKNGMEKLIKKAGTAYLYLPAEGDKFETEQDALEVVSMGMAQDVNRVLIRGERMADDFFRLRTGIAGSILQKWAQYGMKVAMVLTEDKKKGKFEDFLAETNRGNAFRTYTDEGEAEKWLLRE